MDRAKLLFTSKNRALPLVMECTHAEPGGKHKHPSTRIARATTQTPELGHPEESYWPTPWQRASWHRCYRWAERRVQLRARAALAGHQRAAEAANPPSPPSARSLASTDKGRDRPPGNARGRHAQRQAISGARRTRGGIKDNSRDQMVQATRGPPSTQNAPILGQYDYNAGGQRVRHHLSDRGNVDYYYDEGSVIEERDGVSGELKAFYRYAEQLLSLATPADGEQFYHQDALGSTVNLTDSSGNKAVSYKTDPWGQVREQSGTSVNRKSFTGQERDEKTGLLYYGARYYDADIGRFASQDSYLGQGGVPPSLNRYAYAYSNPGRFVDPTGHAPADASQAWREYSTNDIGDENVCDQSGDCQGTGR